eukprot:gene13516-biopygen11074
MPTNGHDIQTPNDWCQGKDAETKGRKQHSSSTRRRNPAEPVAIHPSKSTMTYGPPAGFRLFPVFATGGEENRTGGSDSHCNTQQEKQTQHVSNTPGRLGTGQVYPGSSRRWPQGARKGPCPDGSEWRKRIPAYTVGPRQMHRAPGLAGADRTQKVGIRRPKKPVSGLVGTPSWSDMTLGRDLQEVALARVLGSEWRKRIPAYTAGPRQMRRAPGLAGADRTQKVGIRRPKNRFRGPAVHPGSRYFRDVGGFLRLVDPGGTPRKSVFSRFWWIFASGGPPRTPPTAASPGQFSPSARGLNWPGDAAVGGVLGGPAGARIHQILYNPDFPVVPPGGHIRPRWGANEPRNRAESVIPGAWRSWGPWRGRACGTGT